MRAALILALATRRDGLLLSPAGGFRATPRNTRRCEPPLPKIAPAPEFALTSQDGAPVTLADFRGKVVAVTFIFTMCTATCPVLTPMMSFVQDQLGRDFGAKIAFISITVDPERDTPPSAEGVCAVRSAPISPAGSSLPAPRRPSGT